MILGVIADDFTGASDVAAMLSRGGMRTELFVGTPDMAAHTAEAGVVALKSRSIAASEAVAQSLAALAWLRRAGCEQIVFKYCSTFDSTPGGNIGPVGEALAAALGAKGVVACPALPENGRAVFMGHLFVNGRLLNESGLEKHPLNPMTDPDIQRWLSRQCRGPVGLIDERVVAQGEAAIAAALAAATETMIIVDAISDADLRAIGRAAADAPLITGASGVAMALPDNWRARGRLAGVQPRFSGADGPGVVLSGSCSPMTRQQVAAYLEAHPGRPVDVVRLMAGPREAAGEVEALRQFVAAPRAAAPLVYSSADPAEVAAAQRRYGREPLAAAIEHLFGTLVGALVQDGVQRIVVAGGETSGAVVSALGIRHMLIGPEIAPGVPALAVAGEPQLRLALKSGNFGAPSFFAEALDVLGGKGR